MLSAGPSAYVHGWTRHFRTSTTQPIRPAAIEGEGYPVATTVGAGNRRIACPPAREHDRDRLEASARAERKERRVRGRVCGVLLAGIGPSPPRVYRQEPVASSVDPVTE
jgi:hypothetical protein